MRKSGKDHFINKDLDTETKIDHLGDIRQKVKTNLNHAYENYRKQYNLRTRPRQFKEGDTIYVRNFKLSNAGNEYSAKVARNFRQGIVKEKVGENMYKIADLSGKIIGTYDAKDIKVS